MTKTEKAIRDFCGHHADWWPSTTQVKEMLALAQPEQMHIEKNMTLACPSYLHDYTTPPQRKPLSDERIESVRHMRDVQGYDGNWNYDPYMQGLYNGLEFALSLLEVREPQFKDAPETWLGDIKVKYKLSSETETKLKE